VRGRNVFSGYWGNDEATREILTDDGWLRTGDLGEFDTDSFRTVIGRTKELIVTETGKNVAPEPLEERIAEHPLVSRAIVVGEGRPFVGALVTLDDDELKAFAERHGLTGRSPAELRDDPSVRDELQQAIEAANEGVSRAESVREFIILDRQLSSDRDGLTPTMKPRRREIAEHLSDEIERLYG
jgi:long-chain acyl-CoA synthetase